MFGGIKTAFNLLEKRLKYVYNVTKGRQIKNE